MRILYAGHSLREPLGGGELSARTLVFALGKSHRVDVIGIGAKAGQGELSSGVVYKNYQYAGTLLPFPLGALHCETKFRSLIARHIEEKKPDLVILQQPAYLQPEDIEDRVKLLVFVRSLMCFGIGDPSPGLAGRIAREPFRRLRFSRNRPLLERADLLVTNSRFLQRELKQRTGLESEVVHPIVDTRRLSGPRTESITAALTFVGLDKWKGASVALNLARGMTERQFLFLKGARSSRTLVRKARQLTNVSVLSWCDDMAEVFARTRVLLVPSVWEEPFGRLPVEAGAFGIPTIASACGGLPESVGAGGILVKDFRKTAGWFRAIRALDDVAHYRQLSLLAMENAARLDAIPTLARFRTLVEHKLDLVL